jgi:nucleotide-binding universal stress UspA family protein
MKRFKHLLVHLAPDPDHRGILRYVQTLGGLCESKDIDFLSESNPLTHKLLQKFPCEAQIRWVPLEKGQDAASKLVELASRDDYDLIVTGQNPGSGVFVRRLLQDAPCSVMLVHPDAAPLFRKVMVAVDFSSASHACTEIGLNLARMRQLDRVFVHHAVTMPLMMHRQALPLRESKAQLMHEARVRMQAFLSQFGGSELLLKAHLTWDPSVPTGIRAFGDQLHPDLIILPVQAESEVKQAILMRDLFPLLPALCGTLLFYQPKQGSAEGMLPMAPRFQRAA